MSQLNQKIHIPGKILHFKILEKLDTDALMEMELLMLKWDGIKKNAIPNGYQLMIGTQNKILIIYSTATKTRPT